MHVASLTVFRTALACCLVDRDSPFTDVQVSWLWEQLAQPAWAPSAEQQQKIGSYIREWANKKDGRMAAILIPHLET